MSVPSRLRWLLPGFSLAPAVAASGCEALKAPVHLLAILSAREPGVSFLMGYGSALPLCPACRAHGSARSYSASSSAPPPSCPPTEHSSSRGLSAGAGYASTEGSPATGLSGMSQTNSFGNTATHGRDSGVVNGGSDVGQLGHKDEGEDSSGHYESSTWRRLSAGACQVRLHSNQQRQHQDGKDKAASLAATAQRVRESLRRVQEASAAASGGGEPVLSSTAVCSGKGSSSGGGTGLAAGASGISRAEDPPALHWRRAAPAVGTSSTTRGGKPMPVQHRQTERPPDPGGGVGTATAAAPKHYTSSEARCSERSLVDRHADDTTAEREDSSWRIDGMDLGAASLTTVPQKLREAAEFGEIHTTTDKAVDTAVDGPVRGGGRERVIADVRVIRHRSGTSLAAAAANRDADLMRRILELQELREAELLVYDVGMGFRSLHAAELIARLPELDLQDSNAGPRIRRLLRFLSSIALRDIQPLPGPTLARCLTTFARLSYAPPETVAPLCASLTAAAARKLRACSGNELADLAWALAVLEHVYGDMHQAVRQPARGVSLTPSVRILGYVRGGFPPRSDALSEEWSDVANGTDTVRKEGTAMRGSLQTAEARTLAENGLPQEVLEAPRIPALEDGESTVASCSSNDVTESSHVAEYDDADVQQELQAVRTSVMVRGEQDQKEEEEDYAMIGKGGDGDVGFLAPQRPVPELMWLVPRAMDRIWERLAVAAGFHAEQGRMGGEQLAKVAWAYAKVGRADKRLYDKLSAATMLHLEPFLEKAQAAAAAVALPQRRGFRRKGPAAALTFHGPAPLDSASVTNLVWAFVEMGQRAPQLLTSLAIVASSYKATYDNDEMATLAKSYAQAQHYDERLCAAFAMVALRRHRHLTGPQLVALITSLAALRHRDDELAGSGVARMVQDKRSELSAEQVCDLMWACAQLRLDSRRAADSPGTGVLGLEPGADSATTAAAIKVHSRTAASIGGRFGSGGGCATGLLARAIRGRCEGLPPAHLARALWAVALLKLPTAEGGRGGGTTLRLEVVSELRHQLARHPVESYSRKDLLLLYSAAHVLAPMLPPPSVEVAALAVEDSVRPGVGTLNVGTAAACAIPEGQEHKGAEDAVHVEEGRVQEDTQGVGLAVLSAVATARCVDIDRQSPGGAEGSYRGEGAQLSGKVVAGQWMYDTDCKAAAAAAAIGAQKQDLEGGGTSSVRLGSGHVRVPGPAAELTSSVPGTDTWNTTNASAAASLQSSYDIRRVFDKSSGRELWEVVPKGRPDGSRCDSEPLERVLPAELLAMCKSVAVEWSESERQRLEAVEMEEGELWRLDVWEALRELTGEEPQPNWVARGGAAVADLLVLQSHPSSGGANKQRPRGAAGIAGSGVAAAAPPPAPLAVLLVGAADCTRNAPFIPLGSVRMRQLLLEAAGARVLIVPHFLWRVMGDSPDDHICLLANLLGCGAGRAPE